MCIFLAPVNLTLEVKNIIERENFFNCSRYSKRFVENNKTFSQLFSTIELWDRTERFYPFYIAEKSIKVIGSSITKLLLNHAVDMVNVLYSAVVFVNNFIRGFYIVEICMDFGLVQHNFLIEDRIIADQMLQTSVKQLVMNIISFFATVLLDITLLDLWMTFSILNLSLFGCMVFVNYFFDEIYQTANYWPLEEILSREMGLWLYENFGIVRESGKLVEEQVIEPFKIYSDSFVDYFNSKLNFGAVTQKLQDQLKKIKDEMKRFIPLDGEGVQKETIERFNLSNIQNAEKYLQNNSNYFPIDVYKKQIATIKHLSCAQDEIDDFTKNTDFRLKSIGV